jgi:hypothetical protein
VDREDLGMGEPGRDADFAEETPWLIGAGAVGKEYLEGHLSAVLQILRQIHRGHASAADLFLDAISFRQGGTQALRNLTHNDGPPADPSLSLIPPSRTLLCIAEVALSSYSGT